MPSNYERCRRCHDFSWAPCDCKRWEISHIWNPKDKVEDAEWDEVYGRDPGRIVEAWAHRYDSGGDYTIVGGSEADVWLRDEDGNVTKWTVYGETVPEYHARKLPAVSAAAEVGK